MRTDQIGNFLRAALERLEESLRGPDLILIWRLRQKLDTFLVRGLFLFRRTCEPKVAKGFLFIETQATEERELCVSMR